MFWEFFRFELRFWFRGWMVYIFLAIMSLLFFAAASSDQIVVGQAMGNTNRNAPYVIQMYYAMSGILCGLMVTAFVDSAASRDFATKSSDMVFSKPISKGAYIFGRFFAASIAALVPTLGASLGILLAKFGPWIEASRWGAVDWSAHLNGIIVFAIPNTLIYAAIVFAISVLTRSTLYSFIGTLLFIVAYAISGSFLEDMENERLGAMLDPMGVGAFSVITKYWSVEEKNTLSVGLSGLMLANRALWMGVVSCILACAYWRFTFAEGSRRSSRSELKLAKEAALLKPMLFVEPRADGFASHFQQFISHFRNDFRGVIRSTVFLVLMLACALNMIPAIWFDATANYGQHAFPVTYNQVDLIRGTSLLFVIAIITFFAGVLSWRDRDVRLNEILGAQPYPNWTAFLSRFLTLAIIIESIFCMGIVVAVLAQLAGGYTRLQLGVYVQELLVIDFVKMSFLAMLAFLMHTLAPNKYIGYFLFIIGVVANAFLWNLLRVDTLLVKFGRFPGYTYSDMFGIAPYRPGLIAFGVYWAAFCLILAWFCTIFAHRGIARPLLQRVRFGFKELSGGAKAFVSAATIAWLSLAGWLYYNTQILNQFTGSHEREIRQVDYEKKYKATEKDPLPSITSVQYEIDIFPEERNLVMKGKQDLINKTTVPIDTLAFTIMPNLETSINITGAKRETVDERLGVWIYKFDTPLLPGTTIQMDYQVKVISKGFENSVSNIEINQNGTFFNNSMAPAMGYASGRELTDPKTRAKYSLPKSDGFPALSRESSECMHHYIGESDWVNVETVISTSADQIAVAPGSLVEQWEKDGRRYYRYRVDHPSLNFYSFISARYKVAREKWNDVDVEVYFHPEHEWNVPRMIESIKSSLEYCSKNFGPYRHKQARIIEFPRTASFAQAFPGTMPYSESIGFIANLKDPEDIDFVFYVVAHEMAHQWWAHQVIGAKMQGATLLSESLAQYSALMIMEHHYGREMMRKFLKYEMDRYLSSRGREAADEKPLLEVNPSQGYVHYQKGSVVLYYLKEMIGEERVNVALKNIIDKFAYRDPPYPNSYTLVDELKKQLPPELQYLIKDLFEDITLFANRTIEAKYRKLDSGKYRVTIDVECEKFKSDPKGKNEPAELHDWIEIGAFAKPETGKKYGKPLYRERIFVDKTTSTFEFDVDEVPELVGIDPYFLLVDRMPDDNLKKATLVE
jgi:ABC-2 type transport system permease protein